MELFLKEIDTAPLALLLWLSGAAIVLFPKIVSDTTTSIWSVLAIIVTGVLAFQINGVEHMLPAKAKITMVACILLLLLIALLASFISTRRGPGMERAEV